MASFWKEAVLFSWCDLMLRQAFIQWQHSFQMKAVLPLAKRLVTAPCPLVGQNTVVSFKREKPINHKPFRSLWDGVWFELNKGLISIWRCIVTHMENPIVVIRWSNDCHICKMEFPSLVKWLHFVLKLPMINWLNAGPTMCPWTLATLITLTLVFFKIKFWNSHISEMGGMIDMEWKWCESIIHDHNHYLWVSTVGWVDVLDNDHGDFRCVCAIDISSLTHHTYTPFMTYRKTSNTRHTLECNIIVDHSDVVGASPVGATPTTSSFSTWHLASRDSAKTVSGQYENLSSVGIWCDLY